jgi:hypothetical protein
VAHNTTEAQLPPIELTGDWSLLFEAISPTTGAAVAGVTVANIAVYGDLIDTEGLGKRIIPVLTPEEVEGL